MLPSVRPGATIVVALSLCASLLLGDQPWAQAWRLDLGTPLLEQAWTLVTAGFSVPEGRLVTLLPHLFVQWWIGGRLEMFWGTKRYLAFAVVCSVVAVAVAGITAQLLGGLPGRAGGIGGPLGLDMAVLLGFAVVFANERYELPGVSAPMGARPIAGLSALAVIMPATSAFRDWPMLLLVPGALLVAGAFLWQPWRRSSKSGKLGRAKKASHLRVVRSADDLLN